MSTCRKAPFVGWSGWLAACTALGLAGVAGAATHETYILVVDATEDMGEYWNTAFRELIDQQAVLRARGAEVEILAVKNGSWPAVLKRGREGLMWLETREGHPIKPGAHWAPQIYRGFGRALDIFEPATRNNKRVTVVIWSSGKATDSIFQKHYKRGRVLGRFQAFQQKYPEANAHLAIQWKVRPGIEPKEELRDFIEVTQQGRSDEVSVRPVEPPSLEAWLPPPGEDAAVSTPSLAFELSVSPSLIGVEYMVLAQLRGQPNAKVRLIGLDPRARFESTESRCEFRLDFSAADLREGDNTVDLQFAAKLAEEGVGSRVEKVVHAKRRPVKLRLMPDPSAGVPESDLPTLATDKYASTGSELAVMWQNLGKRERVKLTAKTDAKGVTAGLRRSGTQDLPHDFYEVDGSESSTMVELLLQGTAPEKEGAVVTVRIDVDVPRQAEGPKRAEFRFKVPPPPPPDIARVELQIEPKSCEFLGGERQELLLITMVAPQALRDKSVEVTLSPDTERSLSEYFDSLELADASGKRLPFGAQRFGEDGRCVIRVLGQATVIIPETPGSRKDVPMAVTLKPVGDFALGTLDSGEPYTCMSKVTFWGPAALDVSGHIPRTQLKEVLVGETLAGLRFLVSNTTPERPLPRDTAIKVYLDRGPSAGRLAFDGVAEASKVAYDPTTESAMVQVTQSGQPIEFTPLLRAAQAGEIDAALVFETGAPGGLRFKDGKAQHRVPLAASCRAPYVDTISWEAPEKAIYYHGGSFDLQKPLSIRGRALPGQAALRVRFTCDGLDPSSRLAFDRVAASGKESADERLSLKLGEETLWPLPVGENHTIDVSYWPTLQLGGGDKAMDATLTLRFERDEQAPVEMPDHTELTMGLSVQQPELRFDRPTEFAAAQEPKRGWTANVQLAAADWLPFFRAPWSTQRLDQAVSLTVSLKQFKRAVRDVSVVEGQASDMSLQGRSLREWLEAAELEVFVPAWDRGRILPQAYTMSLAISNARWLGEVDAISGTLPELQGATTGRKWFLVLGILAVAGILTWLLIINSPGSTQMVGELVPEDAVAREKGLLSSYKLSGQQMPVGSSEAKVAGRGILLPESEAVRPHHADLEASAMPAGGVRGGRLPIVVSQPDAETAVDDVVVVQSRELQDGATVRFGDVPFMYRVGEEAAAHVLLDEDDLLSGEDAPEPRSDESLLPD